MERIGVCETCGYRPDCGYAEPGRGRCYIVTIQECKEVVKTKAFQGIYVDVRLKALIEEVCNEYRIDIIEMEIMPDHVHLLMEVDPQLGIHKAVKQIKGRTSRILRQEFSWLTTRLPTLWTNSYFVSTVGGAPLSVIKQYIENQKYV